MSISMYCVTVIGLKAKFQQTNKNMYKLLSLAVLYRINAIIRHSFPGSISALPHRVRFRMTLEKNELLLITIIFPALQMHR